MIDLENLILNELDRYDKKTALEIRAVETKKTNIMFHMKQSFRKMLRDNLELHPEAESYFRSMLRSIEK